MHHLDVQVVHLSARPRLGPPKPHPTVNALNRVAVVDLQLEVEQHLVVGLSNLEDVELVGAVLAFTGANRVLLHASLVPDLKAFVLETQHALRDVRHLIGVMHDAEGVGDEGGHEDCEFIVADSGLAHRVKLLHVSIHALQVGCGHNSECAS